MPKNYDFSGFATKVGLKCSDGRTIMKGAFKHCDGARVPLVFAHLHKDIKNVLGHAILEDREEGTYCYCKFNDSAEGQAAKERVQHGDITSLSIYANQLQESNRQVQHGIIREVSLVLAGANPGAIIDNVTPSMAHGLGYDDTDFSEAIIHTGETFDISEHQTIQHADEDEDDVDEGDEGDEEQTIQDVFDTLNDDQTTAVYAVIAAALDNKEDNVAKQSELEGENSMKHNVFDAISTEANKNTLTHDQLSAIVTSAKAGGSWKEAFLQHAKEYGIDVPSVLFPETSLVGDIESIKRDDDWVRPFLGATKKVPFSRLRSIWADITEPEARAKGYITGKRKLEEVIKVGKRTTDPTTIYKKQKLDRDDVVDITDFDIVAWLWKEIRALLEEELAKAALVGDGRSASSDDQISPDHIRPIWTDDSLYSSIVTLPERTATTPAASTQETLSLIDAIMASRKYYKGKGRPNLYTTADTVISMLLVRDTTGRKIYPTMTDLKSTLGVGEIVEVEQMEGLTRTRPDVDVSVNNSSSNIEVELLGILTNPQNYAIGTTKGGEITQFTDFDIDYNQHKYLMETRCSGALVVPKSAVIIEVKLGDEDEGTQG